MNKVWGIDFDSTINDLNKHICATLRLFHGCDVTPDQISHWHFWDDHPLGEIVWGERMYHNEEWTLSIPPLPDALQVIHTLLARGDKVIVISDRFNKEFAVVRKWMDRNSLGRVPLLLTNKTKSKATIAAMAGCTAVFDDSPHWIERYTRAKTIRDIYVMDYAYNVDVPKDNRIIRVADWKQLEKMEFATTYDYS